MHPLHSPIISYLAGLLQASEFETPRTGTSKDILTTIFKLVIQFLSPQLGCKFHKMETVYISFIRVSSMPPPCLALNYLLSERLNINKLVLLEVVLIDKL